MTGTLYVCATPIGHLEDCSQRLLNTLTTVDFIAAEDTRVIKKLLSRFDIRTQVIRLDEHTERSKADQILDQLKKEKNIALVSDAGTPCISDPGSYLISYLMDNGMSVVPIPGPSSITTFLSVSGLPANRFYFGGFFPRKKNEATDLCHALSTIQSPLIFFESGKRLVKSLSLILDVISPAQFTVGKELTKKHESVYRGPAQEILSQLSAANPLKGEWLFTYENPASNAATDNEAALNNFIDYARKLNLDQRQTVEIGAKWAGLNKNLLKKTLINNKK